MHRIGRRDLFTAGSALLAGGLLKKEGKGQSQDKNYTTLECKWIEQTLDGTRIRMRTYNGQVPGPLIKAAPGETLHIRVKNSLPTYDSKDWNGDHNVPHALSTTNLHLHGLDIRPHLFQPLGTTDPLARMVAIEPGGQLDYSFQIPADHPPGLYWYHPHHHGSTAVQATSGMAGPVIVYGNIDQVPEIKAARDIPLVVQDLGLFQSETDATLWLYEPRQNAIWQTFQNYVTIYDPKTGKTNPTSLKGGFSTGDYPLHYFLLNGEPFFKETHNQGSPTIPDAKQLPVKRFTLAPGEVVRFRMLNACSDNLMPIVVQGHAMYLIAIDGVNFPAPQTLPAQANRQVLLAPANRAEFLIKASMTPGVYPILQLAQEQQFALSAQKVIAEIEVKGPAKDMPLPQKLPTPSRYYPLIQADQVKRTRTIAFSGAFPAVMNPYVGGDFSLNNALYQETAVQQVVDLGGVEEWIIQVGDAHHGGSEGHPFHIHVNHFEVISINGAAQPPGVIQDTIWVPTSSAVVIRMKFKQWTGKAVYHCHILPHEDTGMMANFLILANGGAAHGGGHA
jgi:suppressor of ftsI